MAITSRTTEQNKMFYAVCGKKNIDADTRASLCLQFSNQRTNKSSELSMYEMMALIKWLRKQDPEKPKEQTPEKQALQKMRLKIFSMSYDISYVKKVFNSEKNKMQIDAASLNEFVVKHGYLKKPLNKYTYNELPKLVTQFENILKSDYAKR